MTVMISSSFCSLSASVIFPPITGQVVCFFVEGFFSAVRATISPAPNMMATSTRTSHLLFISSLRGEGNLLSDIRSTRIGAARVGYVFYDFLVVIVDEPERRFGFTQQVPLMKVIFRISRPVSFGVPV
jgi:hypothetical protein